MEGSGQGREGTLHGGSRVGVWEPSTERTKQGGEGILCEGVRAGRKESFHGWERTGRRGDSSWRREGRGSKDPP